jgi:cytochrome c oxidase subunit II
MRRRSADRGPGRHRFRTFALSLLALVVLALVLATGAGADALTPDAGPSRNAVDTDTLYKIVFYMGVAVIALVWGVLFYSLVRFRARRGEVAPQVRGNTPLELGWTIGAGLIVVAISVIAFFFLGDIRNPARSGAPGLAQASEENAALNQPPPPGAKALAIKVGAQQYFWRYQYPNGAVSFHDLVVPKDTTVTLDITSNDVAHSWWIPALGGKADAIRGLTNHTWFKATSTGSFRGQCAEFCGVNHAAMTARVIVLEPDAFQRWVQDQKRLIQQARTAVANQRQQGVPGQSRAAGG